SRTLRKRVWRTHMNTTNETEASVTPVVEVPQAVSAEAIEKAIQEAAVSPLEGRILPRPSVEDGVWIPVNGITVPEDARQHTPEDIESRAQSMAKEGQLQNILLSKEGEKLVLVYGHGRLQSAQKLGWEKIRADVKEGLTESQKLLMTLAENEER